MNRTNTTNTVYTVLVSGRLLFLYSGFSSKENLSQILDAAVSGINSGLIFADNTFTNCHRNTPVTFTQVSHVKQTCYTYSTILFALTHTNSIQNVDNKAIMFFLSLCSRELLRCTHLVYQAPPSLCYLTVRPTKDRMHLRC